MTHSIRIVLGLALWALASFGAVAQNTTCSDRPTGSSDNACANTRFVATAVAAIPGGTPGGTSGQIQYNNAGAFGGFTASGDFAINTGTGVGTLATVNSNVGTFGSSTQCVTFTTNAKGLITAASQQACASGGGSGTVTSVGYAAGTGLALTGTASPITTTGTFTYSFAAIAADSFWLNATGSSAVPSTVAFPSCSATTSALTYNTTTHALGCNTIPLGTVTSVGWTGGIVSVATATTTPAFTVAGTSGGVVCFTSTSTWASSGLLAANALLAGGGTGVCPSSVTTGAGVLTAVAIATSSAGGFPILIAKGTSALGTGAISSGTCATVVTTSATNTATTDVINVGFNGDPTAVTGYVPLTSGMLTIIPYPSANNVNFKVCNNTGSSITPGAITLNWQVLR